MVGNVLSVQDLLSRSAAAVKSGRTNANMSAVQKLLAQRDTPIKDIVDISPVQKILQGQETKKTKQTDYFKSDGFMRLKVSQLRSQLALYTSIPGLDQNGAILSGIEAEIKDIVQKQQADLQASLAKGNEAKAKLAEQKRLEALAGPSSDDMLARVQGTAPKKEISAGAQKLLDGLNIKV